ncbi:MAG: hypothetical protein JXA15_09455 [Spirochaetales bacterium]|nr:hypothetical protein [Spirochaetales bacterium]
MKTAIVTGGTCNDAPAIGTLAHNLKETANKLNAEFVVFHDGISLKDQDAIQGILPTRFYPYVFPGEEKSFNDTISAYFSTMVFSKYECLRLLDEFEVVIWTDYDVVLLGDISELPSLCLGGFGLIPSPGVSVRDNFKQSIVQALQGAYDLDAQSYSAPIVVVSRRLKNHKELYDYCITKTEELWEHLFLPEQGIFELMIQDFGMPVDTIPGDIYCVHPRNGNVTENVKILHAYGQPKFWNGLKNTDWLNHYRAWRRLGGSGYNSMRLEYRFLRFVKNAYRKILGSIGRTGT